MDRVLFAVGSSCFLIAPFPGFVELVGSGVRGMVFFVGSVFFTSAAALQASRPSTPTVDQAEGIQVARQISDQNWGLLTAITVPGGVELDLYQPRHPTATQPS